MKSKFSIYRDIGFGIMANKIVLAGISMGLSCVITAIWMIYTFNPNSSVVLLVLLWFASIFAGTFVFEPLVGFTLGWFSLLKIEKKYGKQ